MATSSEYTKYSISTTQYRDLANYNKLESGQTEQKVGGWTVEELLAAQAAAPGYRKVVRQQARGREFFGFPGANTVQNYPFVSYSSYRSRD